MVHLDYLKAVLIVPRTRATRFNGRLLQLINVPRLAIPTLAAHTPFEGVSLKVIDENVEDMISPETLSSSADIVGISVMTPAALRAYEIADMYRKLGITVVLGGIHPTVLPDEALQHADIVVKGPGGSAWAQILNDFRSGQMKSGQLKNAQLKKVYDGYSKEYSMRTQSDDQRVTQKVSQRITQRVAFLAEERQLVTSKSVYSIATVQTSEGCPNKCNFCSVKLLHPNFARYNLEDVIKEIGSIEGKYIIFVDDNLWVNKQYAKELFRRMDGLDKIWISQAPITIGLDDELLSLAAKSGCRGVYVGIDSVIEESLRNANKKVVDVAKIPEYIRRIQDRGIFVEAGVIFGFDNEDASVFERTLEFYGKTSVDSLNLHILTPYPGTELRRMLEKEGRIIHNEWDKYDTRHAVFSPKKMSQEQLQEGYEWAWKQSFSLGMIGKRVLRSGHPIYSAIFQIIGMLDKGFTFEEDGLLSKVESQEYGLLSKAIFREEGLLSRTVSRFIDKRLKEKPLTARERNNYELYCQNMSLDGLMSESDAEGCGAPGSYFNEEHYNSKVWDHL